MVWLEKKGERGPLTIDAKSYSSMFRTPTSTCRRDGRC
jgi:hypothetical protein